MVDYEMIGKFVITVGASCRDGWFAKTEDLVLKTVENSK